MSARARVGFIAAAGLAAALCGFAAYYKQLNREPLPATPPAPSLAQLPLDSYFRFHRVLSRTEKEHILDGQFTVVASTEAMPAALKEAFTVISGAQRFAMQNPDWKYPATIDQVIPFRRLMFAGLSANKCFIHYERSGFSRFGRDYAVVVFEVDQHNHLRFLWGGTGPEPATDLADLRTGIAAGRFTDTEPGYYW